MGRVPRGFSLSPDGRRLFVTNSWDDTLSVIDTGTLNVVATWPVGAEPSSVVEDRASKRLFVANRISNDVAVLDARTGVEEKRLPAGRGVSYLALSPSGDRLYATHVYPNPSPQRTGFENRTAPESEITVIDTAAPRLSTVCRCTRSRVFFTSRSRPMAAWAWPPSCTRRTWYR